jgi:hypothetical protein
MWVIGRYSWAALTLPPWEALPFRPSGEEAGGIPQM